MAGCAALATSPAAAQYPSRPVKLVVPFIAGSAPDVLARNVSERLALRLGQPVVIENKGGAGGNVGAEVAAKQPADGYMLMLATSSHLVNPNLYGKVGYDPVTDFAPVALLIKMPSLLLVPNDVVHVPYKGAPEIITSRCCRGRRNSRSRRFPPRIRRSKAASCALAVTGTKRNPQLPEVPTLLEAMPNGFALEAWFGLWAPADTPPDILRKLNADVAAVLADPEFRAKLAADGSEVVIGGTADEFAGYVKSETAKWANVVKESGAKIE